MKTMTKLMIVGALAVSVSACVVHPRGGYSGYPGNSGAGIRGSGSKVEVYGEIDAGVGYTRTKISR